MSRTLKDIRADLAGRDLPEAEKIRHYGTNRWTVWRYESGKWELHQISVNLGVCSSRFKFIADRPDLGTVCLCGPDGAILRYAEGGA